MSRTVALLNVGLLLASAVAAGAATAAPPRRLLVGGDSLGQATVPYLKRQLPHWRIAQDAHPNARSSEGAGAMRTYGRRLAPVIYVSLGTIDDPSRFEDFRDSLREIMRVAGPRRCVVWTNIFRPDEQGFSYRAFNDELERQAALRDNLRIVDWERMVDANVGWLVNDAVHVIEAGYSARARAVAREVRRCRASLSHPRRVLALGDSLAFDSMPFIRRALPRWRIVRNVWFARRAGEAARILRGYGRRLPRVIHMSLGTADDPSRVSYFRRSVRAVMRVAGRHRCVVWTNIWRPVPAGPSFDGYNAELAEEGRNRPNLLVVDWAAMVAANPQWLKPDQVHVDEAGNAARAAAIAAAVRRC
jgi:hypothetical protein